VAFCGNFSGLGSATDLVKGSKDAASLLVCTRKNIFCLGITDFLSSVISGGLSGHLGPLYLVLGDNPSLLILWMTCWGFGFKSYDLK